MKVLDFVKSGGPTRTELRTFRWEVRISGVQFGGPVFAVQTILISGAAISPNYAFGQLGHCCQVNDTCDRVFIK